MPDYVIFVVAKGQVESNMSIIEDLYYGRIAPYEVSMTATPEFEKLKALAAENEDLLRETLSDEQKELLEKFTECVTDISSHHRLPAGREADDRRDEVKAKQIAVFFP